MVMLESKKFDAAKQNALNKLTEAYKAVAELVEFSENPELESIGDAILSLRSSVRFIYEDE